MRTLKSAKAFGRVFKQGRRGRASLVRVTALPVPSEDGSVAFVCAKRLGNAVFRNRSKRVLREAARACGLPLSGYDIILFATQKTAASHPQDVAKDLTQALNKAQVRMDHEG